MSGRAADAADVVVAGHLTEHGGGLNDAIVFGRTAGAEAVCAVRKARIPAMSGPRPTSRVAAALTGQVCASTAVSSSAERWLRRAG